MLEQNQDRFPAGIRGKLGDLVRICHSPRRDRELAFYGSEDLTPSDFYTREDAASALASARLVHVEVKKALETDTGTPSQA